MRVVLLVLHVTRALSQFFMRFRIAGGREKFGALLFHIIFMLISSRWILPHGFAIIWAWVWVCRFAVSIWHVWTRRNKKVIANVDTSLLITLGEIHRYTVTLKLSSHGMFFLKLVMGLGRCLG